MAKNSAGRFSAIRTTVRMTRENDPRFLPYVLLAGLGAFGVVLGLGFAVGSPILFGILAVLTGLLAAVVVLGRRASKAAFAGIEGQPGAGAAVLMSMRGNWRVTPAVAITRNQDLVHRVIGRPGVILVAEGAPSRARELVGNEARKLRRVVGETPIYDVLVGDGEGQVPLKRLNVHLMKLPRNIKPKEVNDLDARLKAMGGTTLPIPKGPMPTRMPRGKIR